MSKICACTGFNLLLAFGGTVSSAFAQQVPDPSFDARVAKPAYKDTHPKVLFDEAHNNFHTAGGGYRPFAELITNDGYQVIPNRAKFTKESLQGHDVLVIVNARGPQGKPAAPAFSEEECDAVRDWVKAGGSLLLIADHFPMGSAAADLARRFGVDMSKGVTGDPAHSVKNPTDLVFSRDNKLLGDHPITKGRDPSERVNRIVTFTGQSLKGPKDSVPLLLLANTALDEVPPDGRVVPAAGRAQGIAFQFGEGRIVVLGEAAMLTAQLNARRRPFGMHLPGIDNRQFALNTMHWLSGLLD
jgi:hypothetical protein